MHFLFSTGSLYTYGLDRCFAVAADAGFDGIELMVDERWDTRQPAYLQTLVSRYELPIRAVHCPFRPVPGWSAGRVEQLGHTVRLAQALGAPVVVHHLPLRIGVIIMLIQGRRRLLPIPGWHPDRSYRDWIAGEAYQELQKESGVKLCIENMPAWHAVGRRWNGFHWNSPDRLTRFPTLTLDTTHLGTWGLEPVEVYTQWRRRVAHVHLSNFDGREHRRPEVGHLDLAQFIGMLAADSYPGSITLELSPDALDAGDDDAHIRQALSASLSRCRAWAGEVLPD
jgi:sugar phosphate isomerase/epimerase